MDTREPLWGELPVEERLARKFAMEKNEQKRVEVTLPEVVEPGHETEAKFLPKQPREVWELLESQGRKVTARHSTTKVAGTEFKSGKRKGETRPDKYIDHYSVVTIDRQLPVFYVMWSDGQVIYARVRLRDHTDLYPRNVTEVKQLIGHAHG